MTPKHLKDYSMTRSQAKAMGFSIDSTCYPNVAYKGPRFNVTEFAFIYTETEERLGAAQKCIVNGCPNDRGAGGFYGVLCTPCHEMLLSGKVGNGQTFIHGLHRHGR